MVTLWLVRHAQPLVAPGMCYGQLDLAADPDATVVAARTLHQALPAQLPIFCSPLQRCQQLALALCHLRPGTPLQTDPRLAELDFGQWEGQAWSQIGAAALDAWVCDFAHHAPGGGESVHSLLTRVQTALQDAQAGGQDQIWITHAGVLRALDLLQNKEQINQLQSAQWPKNTLKFGEWQHYPLPG